MKPENSAMNTNFLKYQSVVKGTEEWLDPALKGAPEMMPPEGSKLIFAKSCGEKATQLVDRLWTNLLK